MPKGIYLRTPIHVKKISQNLGIGRKHTEEEKKKISIALKGRKITPIHRKRIALAKIGKPRSIETKEKLRKWHLGRKLSKMHILAIKNGNLNHRSHLWKGGITPLIDILRSSYEYEQWKKQILERDNYTCKRCNAKEKLNAHHKISFSIILENFFRQFRDILLKLAFQYYPLWDLNNGETLCENCHKKTDTYFKKKKYTFQQIL